MEGVPLYPAELKTKYQQSGWWLGTTVLQAFDRTCDAYPEKKAIAEGEHWITFSELRDYSKGAAVALKRLGIADRDPVLLQVPNMIEAIYIYLGLLRIGGVPILCLPRHGQRELERFAKLAEARAWIGPAGFGSSDYLPVVKAIREKVPSVEHAVVVRDDAPPGFVSFSQLMEGSRGGGASDELEGAAPTDPNGLLHLAPTGGTTGLLKLVPKTHNNHLMKANNFAQVLGLGPDTVGLVISPINHDGPQGLHIGTMVLAGCSFVMCPSTRAKDIVEHIEREKVTYCFLVPALLGDLVNMPDLDKHDLSSLRTVIISGARCPTELVKLAFEKIGNCFYNCFGMTEGAGTITRKGDPIEVISGTVGTKVCPLDEYRIVDETGMEVPAGHEGELEIQGPCVVAGYYKSEAELGRVFAPDGFLRTGDLGRFDGQGNLIITGRKKDIINRGGDKVSPYDIEEMIMSHPGVLRAAVIGMPDERLGERICAYVQPKQPQGFVIDELISYLKAQGASLLLLPERVEVVAALPLTAVDKVDKQRLREDITQKLWGEG